MAVVEKIAKTAVKTGLRRATGTAMAFVGGPVGVGISALMWLPEIFRLFGWGLEKIRGTGIGKQLLGISDEELIKKIKTETKRLEGRDALAVYQEEQILKRRETGRESFGHNRVGLEEGYQIQELDTQIAALKIGSTLRDDTPEAVPTSQEALQADAGSIDPRSEPKGEAPVPQADTGLLTEDEREDMRAALIEVGLPSDGEEVF